MSTCEGCASPNGGIVITTCRACQIRHLARGPAFFASMRQGKLTPEYRTALRAIGDDEAAVHAEVRAAAKKLVYGSTPA